MHENGSDIPLPCIPKAFGTVPRLCHKADCCSNVPAGRPYYPRSSSSGQRTASSLQRTIGDRSSCLSPVMRTPVAASAVISMCITEPRPVIAIGRRNDDANYRRRWNVYDRARRRWRVPITRRGAVRLNHLGAGVRAQSRSKPEREHRQCDHNNFVSHHRYPFCCLAD
jgi:hypothetical protein